MNMNAKLLSGLLTIGLGLGAASTAHATSITVSVAGTAAPWDPTLSGNSGFAFGVQDNTAATVVNLASLGLSAGNNVFVAYKGGFTDAFCSGSCLILDNGGQLGSIFKDDDPGSLAQHFPSFSLPGEWGSAQFPGDPVLASQSGLFLNALIGAFTDASGNVIAPFSVGTVTAFYLDPTDPSVGFNYSVQSFFSGAIPVGATQIQFGVNDDIFTDNGGALAVCVASSAAETRGDCPRVLVDAEVPEPATFALVGVGLALAALRRRTRP